MQMTADGPRATITFPLNPDFEGTSSLEGSKSLKTWVILKAETDFTTTAADGNLIVRIQDPPESPFARLRVQLD